MRALAVLVLCAFAHAQDPDELLPAGEAIDLDLCHAMRDEVMPRVEAYTRMKFRRPVPIRVESKAEWDAQKKAGTELAVVHALAYYRPDANDVTVVPWVIGGYDAGTPALRSRGEWIAELQPTLIHELTHAIHHQNFHTEGRYYAASLKVAGLTEEELDRSTVEFILGEGVPEIVALRTTDYPDRNGRWPRRELSEPRIYMRAYQPNGHDPYRMVLFATGYQDGLDLMHHLSLKTGARGVRAMLYRPPPRALLFSPQLLAQVDLDDPPDPDSVFGFLSPELLQGTEIRLAVNPGAGRYFARAHRPPVRAQGCLLGYYAKVAGARYAFFVADPDRPGTWSRRQAAGLKALAPGHAAETTARLPLSGIEAAVMTVRPPGQGLYARAEAGGLVVLAHEVRPTANLEDRVLLALRALFIRRPKPKLYDAAKAEALAAINQD